MDFNKLKYELKGDLYTDDLHRIIYATDGSAYRELPLAVTRPANIEDVKKIISFTAINKTSIIPRGAGTSLAGQVVGNGIVVDVSKYMNRIIEFNPVERWVWVEPGVVLGELNKFLSGHKLMFGPETSTADRCCVGGMLGNNSCGLHSIIYGSVRDHILEVDAILSDGSEVTFKELSTADFINKCNGDPYLLETRIYKYLAETLSDKVNEDEIRKSFPDKEIRRRNHGYAIDELLETDPFTGNGVNINVCKLLAGSEGTLAFIASLKLNLITVPTGKSGLICAHFADLQEALRANIIALEFKPSAIELIDDFIVNCTKDNIEQAKNRFFIKGNPKIILIIEFIEDTVQLIEKKAYDLKNKLTVAGIGYHFPLYTGESEMKRIWALRKAGLGVLLNIPGEKRSVQVIEDTCVHPERYPEYISGFEQILKKYDLICSYYGHIATGELHFSPLLNLRVRSEIEVYHNIATEVAALVKKHRGSLSGEHGDGRLRGEFIPFMLGEHNYLLLKNLKKIWDPSGIFNPGKITDTPSITENLRYLSDSEQVHIKTTFSYPEKGGLLYAIEKCSGSGDCRKGQLMGGTMCPTFMVTGDEDKSTRGRANILREFLTRSSKANPFDHEEIYSVMDLCISCKACKSECPSNVDMASFKAEFLQHYYNSNGIPLRAWLVAWLPLIYRLGSALRPLTNFITGTGAFRKLIGFSDKRNLPPLSQVTLRRWVSRRSYHKNTNGSKGRVYLFADEFINYNESEIGIKTILLLERLGYEVAIPRHSFSGRTLISKGLLNAARVVARKNVIMLRDIISENTPLLGIEPSAILTFRDEYPSMLEGTLKDDAVSMGRNALMLDEFICRELQTGNINKDMFTREPKKILFHGHCQQKAIASTASTIRMLSIPENYTVEEIRSGCCGMAGAFGFEKEHFDLSMKIGEMVLFPAVRNAGPDVLISATGTSCRTQIAYGTGRPAFHPAEILFDSLLI